MGIAQSNSGIVPAFPNGMNYNLEQTVKYILQSSAKNDEIIKLQLNGETYEVYKSQLKDKVIFNHRSELKNFLNLLSLNNPFLSHTIQATLPEQNLYFFLNSDEGRIFKKSFDFLSHSPLQQKNSTTFFQPSPSPQYLQRSNSNFQCSNINSKENNSQNILSEITSSIQSGANKSLTRNNSLSNAKQVAPLPVSILKNKGLIHNHQVISTSNMTKIISTSQITKVIPNEQNNQFDTALKSKNNCQNYINQSARSITPTRAPQPTADTQFTSSNISTLSKAPYLNLSAKHDYNQPQTPVGKSMFDQNQNEDTLNKHFQKTPVQSSIANSVIGSNNYLINNTTTTPTNQNSSNIISIVNVQPQPSSIILCSTYQNPKITQLTLGPVLNNTSTQIQNKIDRSKSTTPISYTSSQIIGNSMFANSGNAAQQYPTTPSGRFQNSIDINNSLTPTAQVQFVNYNSSNLNHGKLMNQNQSSSSFSQSSSHDIIGSSQINQQGLNSQQNYPQSQNLISNQFNNFSQNINTQFGVQQNSNTTNNNNNNNNIVNINIGQLLSQRSSTAQSKVISQSTTTSQTNPNVLQSNKQFSEFTPNQNTQDCTQKTYGIKSLTPQNSSSNILQSIGNNSSQIGQQGKFTSFLLLNDQSQNQQIQTPAYKNNSTINQGSILPTLSTPTASQQEKQQNNLNNQALPYESVRNKFQQLRKITGVRKASEASLSPLNKEKSVLNLNTSQNDQKSDNVVQKSRSISNINYNADYSNEISNLNNSRKLSEVFPSSQNNFTNNKNQIPDLKGLTKNYSCNNMNTFENQLNDTKQQPQQKSSQIPYYFGRQNTSNNNKNNNNGNSKDFSNLHSLSNISQLMFTQEDQSKSLINLGGLPSTKVQNSFLPGLSPIYKNNQADNSRSFFCETLPLVANNNTDFLINNQNQRDTQKYQPKFFNFNLSQNNNTQINDNYLNTKEDKDITDNTKDTIQQIIQRTVTREFEKMKQETEETTQIELDKNQRKFTEFSLEQDQKQFYQSIKNNEILNQTLSDLQNSFHQNTIESVSNKNRQNSSYHEQQQSMQPPPRYPANCFRNMVNNSIQTQSSATNLNNIFSQNNQEVNLVTNKQNQNSLRNNRFNSYQQQEDKEPLKKACSMNNELYGYEIAGNKQIILGRNSQDLYDIQTSLKISEINKPSSSEQISYGMNILQAGGSVSSTFNDLNSFVCRNLESQRQGPYFNISSDNQLSSTRLPLNNPILSSQLQNQQPTNEYNSTPKNYIESCQLNTLSYSTNADITLKKLQNTQIIQVDQPNINNNQFTNFTNFSSKNEQTPTSQNSNFPSSQSQFNNNLMNYNKVTTPKRNDSIQINTVQSQNIFSQQSLPSNNQDIYINNLPNNYKDTYDSEITPKNNNHLRYQSQYQIKIEDNGKDQEKKRQYSSGEINFLNTINELGQNNNNLLSNPNDRQRNISIIDDLQLNNQTPQKLINTATKQKMFDDIERLKKNGGSVSTFQIATNQEIEEIKANANNYWNNSQNNLKQQQQDEKQNQNTDSIYNKISSIQISNNLTEKNNSGHQIHDKIGQEKSQKPFNIINDIKDFQIHSNIYHLETQNPNKQSQTQQVQQLNNQIQSLENNFSSQKPPLQNLGASRAQKSSLQQTQKQSIKKQSSYQFSNQSSPSNQIETNQLNLQPQYTSNNSSLSQISSNNLNTLSPQQQQQLIAQSQEYRTNLKNSQPSQNTPQLQKQNQLNQEFLSSLNPKQLKSYNNFKENYSYALDGQQLFSQQTPQQNSISRIQYELSADQNYDQISEEDDMEGLRPLEEKDLIYEQQQDGIQNYHLQQNGGYFNKNQINNNNNYTYSQQGNLQKYMTHEQIMRLNQQQQLIQQQQQLNFGQEEYYDDLDSDNQEDENSDEISYEQQNLSQNEQEVEYQNNEKENIQQENLLYEQNLEQFQNQEEQEYIDEDQMLDNLQYQNQFYQQQRINENFGQINQNNQDYNIHQQQNFTSNNRENIQQQAQSIKLPTFYNDNFSIQQQEDFNEFAHESNRNQSLRSSKNYLGFSGKILEDNFSSVKKKQNGLYNQKIYFDGDQNFKLNDQQNHDNNIYQSEGFQMYQNHKNKIQQAQYQSLQLNLKLNPQQIQQYQQQIQLMSYKDEQRKLFQQENNDLDEVAEDQLSLSQISQSPLTPNQLQHFKRNSFQQQLQQQNQNYEHEEDYQDEEHKNNNLYYLQQNQMRRLQPKGSNKNQIQNDIFQQMENMDEEQNHVITNKNFIQRKSIQNPQTRGININDLIQSNIHQFGNNDQVIQESSKKSSHQRQSLNQSTQKVADNIDKNNFEIYSHIPQNIHEFGYQGDQQQYFDQQNKLNTQQAKEESAYEDHILQYMILESENKNRSRSQNKERINDANSQERLSQRQLSQRQNSSRYLTSAENVSKKNISRRIFNQSARYYNEQNPSESNKNQKNQNLEQFEAEQKNKNGRASLQDFLQELNEISGRSARGLLDLSHRIQQSNSFILDRSTMNEKSFYQNDKSFLQNEKSFNQNDKSPNVNEKSFNLINQIKSQNEIDDSFQNDNTILTAGCYSTKKENYKNSEQRISEYTIKYNNQDEEEQKETNFKIEIEKSNRNDTGSTTLFENPLLLQNNTSYQPSTQELKFPNKQELQQRLNQLTNTNECNIQEFSNDQPFIITTQQRRRSKDRVDEISIKFKDSNTMNQVSLNQEQTQELQQQQNILNDEQQKLEIEQNVQLNDNLDQIQKDSPQQANQLQTSPFIEERNRQEKNQEEAFQIASFANSDNFISFQQATNSTSTLPTSNNTAHTSANVSVNHPDTFNQEVSHNKQQEQQLSQQNKIQSPPKENNLINYNDKENQDEEKILEKEEKFNIIKSNQSEESPRNFSQYKKSSNNQRVRPISEIPTESKFIKQRQPHFEDSSSKESHARSSSNQLKQKKNVELSIDACNEIQNKQQQHHSQGESKDTPQFQAFGGSSMACGLFKSKKSALLNKREQSMSFLEYQKKHNDEKQ